MHSAKEALKVQESAFGEEGVELADGEGSVLRVLAAAHDGCRQHAQDRILALVLERERCEREGDFLPPDDREERAELKKLADKESFLGLRAIQRGAAILWDTLGPRKAPTAAAMEHLAKVMRGVGLPKLLLDPATEAMPEMMGAAWRVCEAQVARRAVRGMRREDIRRRFLEDEAEEEDEEAARKHGMGKLEANARNLLALLKDPVGLPLFDTFCKREMCEPMLIFWYLVDNFQGMDPEEIDQKTGKPQMKQAAKIIYHKFVLSQQVPGITVNALQRIAQGMATEPTLDMFDETQKNVFKVMLLGTFPRFLMSDLGAQYMWQVFMTDQEKHSIVRFQSITRGVQARQRVQNILKGLEMIKVYEQKVKEERAAVLKALINVQNWIRKYQARKRMALLAKQKERLQMIELEAFVKRAHAMARRMQLCYVSYRARCMVKDMARAMFFKKRDLTTGKCFYVNIRTQQTQWNKPVVLTGENEDVPMSVLCVRCGMARPRYNCRTCSDIYNEGRQQLLCEKCSTRAHKHRSMKGHDFEDVPGVDLRDPDEDKADRARMKASRAGTKEEMPGDAEEAERQAWLDRRRRYHAKCCQCCERAFARRKCCHEVPAGTPGAERFGEAYICAQLYCSPTCWHDEPRSGEAPHDADHYRFMRLDHDSGMWVKVCFECETARATRWCEQCEDPYCPPCFKRRHRRGKKKGHTFTVVPLPPGVVAIEEEEELTPEQEAAEEEALRLKEEQEERDREHKLMAAEDVCVVRAEEEEKERLEKERLGYQGFGTGGPGGGFKFTDFSALDKLRRAGKKAANTVGTWDTPGILAGHVPGTRPGPPPPRMDRKKKKGKRRRDKKRKKKKNKLPRI